MKIPCSSCNQRLEIPEELAGQTIECPACNASLAVPSPEPTAPPTSKIRIKKPEAESVAKQVRTGALTKEVASLKIKLTDAQSVKTLPHRGGMILTFGILGMVCCTPFSIAAWVMGHNDMKLIKAGAMDESGAGTTKAGMICGIVGCVIATAVLLSNIILSI
jgi:hypothetical protein